MDRLTIRTLDGGFLYIIRYNGLQNIVPYYRVDTAIIRLVRRYHAFYGQGV